MTKKSLWLMMLSGLLMFALIIGSSVTVMAEEPKYGGTLTILETMTGLDPITWDQTDWQWKHGNDTGFTIEHMFSGDLQKGPRGTNEYPFNSSGWIPPAVTRGELVESWEKKQNPLRLVFHLRKGIYWMEKPGVMKRREFVASDVAYSMTRLRDARKAIKTYVDFVEKWEATDKYTVTAFLNKWNANWAYRFGWGYYDGIQAPEQEKAGGRDWKNLAGTGPYMLKDYKTGHSTTWVKNKDYWDSTVIDGKKYKLPFVDKYVLMIMKDAQSRVSALRTAKVDLQMAMGTRDYKELKKTAKGLKWAKYPGTGGYMLVMRMDKEPFTDIRVRRALNMAVNREEIIASVLEGEGVLVNYPFPPHFKGVYTVWEDLPKSAQELFIYNPEKAKQLLKEAGYAKGFTFKGMVDSRSEMDMESMVVAYLAKVGVKLILDPTEYPAMMSKQFKKVHPSGYFFSNDHGNPFATIRKNFVHGQTWNPYMMNDPVIEKGFFSTVEDESLTFDQAQAIMKKLAVHAMDQAPAIWLPGGYGYAAWWPWVKNWYGETKVGAHRYGPILARIWLDQDLKKKMGK
jgi:peptide/nickel transport system substrate-binding protein